MVTAAEWAWNDDDLAPTPARVSSPYPAPPVAGHRIGWDGEKYPGGWGDSETLFVDTLLNLDYFTLRQRSTELFETNLYARGIIRRLVTNEVASGLQLEARPIELMLDQSEDELHVWSDRTEAFWTAWASDSRVCDFEQRPDMNLGALTAAARREALVGGDVLVVIRPRAETRLPSVQLIGGHQVTAPLRMPVGLNLERMQHGVELDETGRPVAYHVRKSDSLEHDRIAAFAPDGQRVAWLMYGTDRRIGQHRGVPLLALMLQSLREIDRYRDSTQRKAVIQSIIAMWIEKKEDKMGSLPISRGAIRSGEVETTDFDSTPRTFNLADQIPGMVLEELQHGETPHAFKADGGDTVQFPDFEAAVISSVLWACEIPPEIGRLSFNSNYSASQAALNEFGIYLGVMRERIARSFNQLIYQDWLQASVRRGTIVADGLLESARELSKFEQFHAWTNAAWIGAVKPVTDILKMVKAFEIMADRGWTTNAIIARQLTGTKFQTNARVLMREREELPPPPLPESTSEELTNALLDDPPKL